MAALVGDNQDCYVAILATVSRAISCHQTQVPAYHVLENLSREQRERLWGTQCYYRAFSLVNGGRKVETDLFEGLRLTRHNGVNTSYMKYSQIK